MKKCVIFKKIGFLLFSLCLIFSACESTIILLSGAKPEIKVKDGKAYVNGLLGKKFHKKFKKFMSENPEVKELVLQKIPGSFDDNWNVKTCLLIYENGYNTTALSNSVIESGGVELFISGNKRSIEKGAKLGVHAWYSRKSKKDALDFPIDSRAHKGYLKFYETINVDTAFYWFSLRAAPYQSMHFMTEEEIEFYQLER